MKIKKIMLATMLALSLVLVSCKSPMTTTTATPDLNLSQLAEFDGANGTTAYIAVDGVIYDVTNAADWTDGSHKGMQLAGTDATAAFAQSPHSSSTLADLPVVGNLIP